MSIYFQVYNNLLELDRFRTNLLDTQPWSDPSVDYRCASPGGWGDTTSQYQANPSEPSINNLLNMMSILDMQENQSSTYPYSAPQAYVPSPTPYHSSPLPPMDLTLPMHPYPSPHLLPPPTMRPSPTNEGFHRPVQGRAITGTKLAPNYPPPPIHPTASQHGVPDLPPTISVNFKVPPPGHPPAVPHPTLVVPPPTLSVPPPFVPSHPPPRAELAIELHMRLEESYEQFRYVMYIFKL